MNELLLAGTGAAVANLVLLSVLGGVWVRSYRQVRASHTLGLLVFAAFLLIQNVVWLYFYAVHDGYIAWFVETSTDVQVGMVALCGLQTLALLALVRITWR